MLRMKAYISAVIMAGVCLLTHACGSEPASAEAYKAACRQVPISDLTKNADQYKGKRVKYSGQILVMESSGKTPYKLILSVTDNARVLPGGVLPLYVTYGGNTDGFIYDHVTVYGEVYGSAEYESAAVEKKTLPRIDAKYLEKVPKEQDK